MSLITTRDDPIELDGEIAVYRDFQVGRTHGTTRLDSLTLNGDGTTIRIQADALILAAERRPMRNIEGAIFDTPNVIYCQSRADPKTEADARDTAIAAVSEFDPDPKSNSVQNSPTTSLQEEVG